jgi:TonB-linked SusC/RagA family outer membrane protein
VKLNVRQLFPDRARLLSKPAGCAIALLVALLAGTAAPGWAQHQVTGTVTTEEMAPMSGVMVIVKGTRVGTITNASGVYSLTAPSPQDTLVFSSLGAATQEVPINGRATIAVTLRLQAIALDELVVVGYGAQARALVTGSVSSVSAEEIERTSGTTTGEALLGKIQGLNVRRGHGGTMPATGSSARQARDGRPGAPPAISIRNMGEPLYVIDGVPRDARDFHHLNAGDIESVSVLKDASASVYGFRAANGVILVQTKRGSTVQRPQLQLNGYYGWQDLPRSRMPWGYGVTAYQQVFSYVESEQNLGQPRSMTREELDSWLHRPTYETWDYLVRSRAPQTNLNASVSGGAGDANYYLSVGHVNQDYTMPENNFNRSNIQANLRAELFDGFSIGTEIRGRLENHNTIAASSAYDPVQNLMRGLQSPHAHQELYANDNPDFVSGNTRILARSPVTMRRDISGYQDILRRMGSSNFWAEYKFPFGPTLKGTYSWAMDIENEEYQTKRFDAYCYDAATDTYNVCAGFYGPQRRHLRGQVQSQFGQVLLNHQVQFGSHSLSGVGALELNGAEGTETLLVSVPPTNFSHLVNQVDVNNINNTWNIERRASYAGRFNYDFRQRYLLEALGRYDGSYLYAPDRRWGFFPGVSAGWRITEEPFFRNRIGIFDELKFRISWGQAGREQGISPWGFLGGATYGPVAGGVQAGAITDAGMTTGVRPRGLPVTHLSWVTSTSRNAGVDFEVLNRRLTGEIDIFERKLTGLPAARYDVRIPIEVGYALPNENLESEANRGIDAMIRWRDRIGNLGYSVAPNVTLARQKVLERYRPRYGNSWQQYRNASENRWTNVAFGLRVIGQFQSMEEIAAYPVDIDLQGNRTMLPGDWIFEDVNGDGLINHLDERPIGYGTGLPILSWGTTGGLNYGAFTFDVDVYGGALFSYQVARDIGIPFSADHGGKAFDQSRWRRADPFNDQSEWIPGRYPPLRRASQNHSSYRENTDHIRTKVNFMRIQRVELGYSMPDRLANRIGLNTTKLYTSAANPMVFQFFHQNWANDPEMPAVQTHPHLQVVNVGFSTRVGGGIRPPAAVPVPPMGDDN